MPFTLGIVEVPVANVSSLAAGQRSPAERTFGCKPLLEWVVRRVTDSLLLEQVVILVDPAQSELIRQLAPPDVPIAVEQGPDPLARFVATIRRYDAEEVVRVRLSSPFVDPQLIDRLVGTARSHPGIDYAGYAAYHGGPAVLAQLGLFAEWCRGQALERADREARIAADRNDVTRYLCAHPELFRLRLVPVPPQLDRDDLRLTVRSEEDWEHAQIIFEALGSEALEWQRIAELLDQQPTLRQRMAVLNRVDRSRDSDD